MSPRLASGVALVGLSLGLSACSSSHHTALFTPTPPAVSSSAYSSPTPPSADNSSSAPAASSASSSSSTPSSTTTLSSQQAEQDAVQNGNSGNAAGQTSVAASGNPRGGVGAAPNTSDGRAQVKNFLTTLFSYDTSIDQSESNAGARAAQYASGSLARSLHELIKPSNDFVTAMAHHGYTTVSLGPTSLGDQNENSKVINDCYAVTTTWHGDSGWKAPAPTTETWCATAQMTDSTNGWQITHMSDAGSGNGGAQ